jgi:hypothetical protein
MAQKNNDRPHWKSDPEAYRAWAAQHYGPEDYSPTQRHPCWRDTDFYAEFAAETYGQENFHLFDANKSRTKMTNEEVMAEAQARAKAIINSW